MTFARPQQILARRLVAALVAALLIFSVAESFACGLEDVQASHVSFTPDDNGKSHKATGDACIHGHCHPASIAQPVMIVNASTLKGPALRISLPNAPVLSYSVATLDRPPKSA